MIHEKYSVSLVILAGMATVIVLGAACSGPATQPSPPPATPGIPAPADGWSVLLQSTPFPYSTPLPPPTRTVLDGTYTKFDPKEGTPVPCRRCPDYAPEGGIWKLHLDKGIFRLYHPGTDWRSITSFRVSGEQLELFNDPHCTDVVGVYTWKLEEGALTLQVLEDECAIHLRAMNLTSLPWRSCQPPDTEAAVTGHWQEPPGCQ